MSELPRIPVAAPVLDGNEAEYVMECLRTSWISSHGRFIEEFERAFADYCGVKHAVAANNGTTALHLALVALGVQPGDEVIVPALTYVASANTVHYCGATPVFVDNDPATLNIDPAAVQAAITPRTKGIMPVHLYGNPADMAAIGEIARRHGLFVLEDAAEAIGARFGGRRVGGIGDAAAFSFFGNKIITTGEGGMVTTNDDGLAARLRQYRGQGVDPERRYWFPVIGYNYRMTNVAAAIGLAQLERIESHQAARRRVAEGYGARLAGLRQHLAPQTPQAGSDPVCWMYTVLLTEPDRCDAVRQALDADGVETRPLFPPLCDLPPYLSAPRGPVENARSSAARGINLPTHGALTDSDLDRVAQALARALA